MTIDNTIVINLIADVTTGELDFDMYNDILSEEKVAAAVDENGINTIGDGGNSSMVPLKIEILKNAIAKFEKLGCNYISIDCNEDHPDYTFNGYDIHVATETEIDEVENKKRNDLLEKAAMQIKAAEKLITEANNLLK